jgi:hypothetical protein
VSDGLPIAPAKRTPDDTGGYGLTVIEQLADVTVITCRNGKTVRAQLKQAPDHTHPPVP